MRSKSGIYTPLGADGHELCHPFRQEDFETINVEVDGTPRASTWKPLPMRLIREDEGQRLALSDSPWLGSHALIFKPTVVEAVGPILRQYGELLPLICSEAEVVMYNPTRLIDALDESTSSVVRFSEGNIMWIKRYGFRADVVGELDIFKIPNLRLSPTFLSERFVDRWRKAGLAGLDFERVWLPPN